MLYICVFYNFFTSIFSNFLIIFLIFSKMIFEILLPKYSIFCSEYFKYHIQKSEFRIDKINHQDPSFKVFKI